MLWDKRDAHPELLLWDAPAAAPCSIPASFAEPQGKEAAAEQEVGVETPSPVHAAGRTPRVQNIPNEGCGRAVRLHHWNRHTIHHPILRRAAAQALPLS